MHDPHDLAVLGEQATVRHVHHLQDFRIVTHLQRHRIYVLRTLEQHIDRESRAGCLSQAGRIEDKTGFAWQPSEGQPA